ncbi:MAG: carbon monoxide dehydrogenase, partial [Chloroflexi bacterium]|nr:carbon monoxide dehydrogenase [Chloroflexota bacterium]
KVDDIPQRFSISKNGVKLLILGTVKKGGSGCFCPESALLRSLMSYLVFLETDIVIMDMDAGVEHLGRGTSQGMDAFIIVVEPGKRSIQTAESIKKLSSDLGIKKCFVVGNKIKKDSDREFIKGNTSGFEVIGYINYHPELAEADLKGESVFDYASEVIKEIKIIKEKLESVIKGVSIGKADH